MDPENSVVILCAQGMQAEAERRPIEARALFEQAWQARSDDYEAAVAAHFLARHQASAEETMAWNQRALDHGLAAPPEQVADLMPSLYLNLAHSHELLGHLEQANEYVSLGERWLPSLPSSPYADVVRDGLTRLRLRLAGHH